MWPSGHILKYLNKILRSYVKEGVRLRTRYMNKLYLA